MRKYRAILKEPGKKPELVNYSNSLNFLDGILDGPPKTVRVMTESGKKITIFYGADACIKKKDYNFTLMILPDNKKYWLDFIGTAIIFGRDEEDNLLDCPLSIEEAEAEIFKVPYDE